MPGSLSSPDLARKAKLILPNMGVLFTSGYTQNAIVHGGRLDPGVELLSKPYTREALARKIRHVLANQKHIQQLKSEINRMTNGTRSSWRSDKRALRVLVVEDDDSIRQSTCALIEQLGHRVTSFSEGGAALRQLEIESFDVAVVDVGLADMSGIELANTAKALYPDLRIVYATGQSEVLETGKEEVLRKPYGRAELERIFSKA
jgi:CheY-like chemotaxis protein